MEAIDHKNGRIDIKTKEENGLAIITVTDNGKGIPKKIIDQLGKRGNTFGKKEGTGLGLFHAKTTLKNWGGSLSINSNPGKGTDVIIRVKMPSPPNWFVDEVIISSDIIILDDDPSIHKVWEQEIKIHQN